MIKHYNQKSIFKWTLILMISCLLLPTTGNVAHAQSEILPQPTATPVIIHSLTKEVETALEHAQSWLIDQEQLSDWTAIGIGRNGNEVPDRYRLAKGDEILSNQGQYDKVSSLALSIMGYTEAGVNISDVAGISLSRPLVHYAGMEAEGAYGLALAAIAYSYGFEANYNRQDWYPDLWYYKLIELQLADGSWPKLGEKVGDLQSTMLAMQTFKKEYKLNDPDNTTAKWLLSQQAKDGSFNNRTTETAYGLIALTSTAYESEPINEVSYAIEKALQYMLEQQLPNGGFAESTGTVVNIEATEQAFLALTAYKYWLKKEPLLEDKELQIKHASIVVEGPNGVIARGYTNGATVGEAVQTFLNNKKISYKLNESTVDPLNKEIIGIKNIMNNTTSSWQFAVLANELFTEKYEKYKQYSLIRNGDAIIVYYGKETLENDISMGIKQKNEDGFSIDDRVYKANTPFSLQIQRAYRFSNGTYKMTNATNVTVQLNGKSYTTDSNGIVKISGLPTNIYEVTISDSAKTLVPVRYTLSVDGPELAAYKDESQVASWARYDVSGATTFSIMKGTNTDPMLWSPKKQLTRAEFVTMLLRVVKMTGYEATGTYFTDVLQEQWYSKSIYAAVELGIADKVEGKFRPNSSITREEAAVMLMDAGKLQTFGHAENMSFHDIDSLPKGSLQAIQAVQEYRIMKGSNDSFRPTDYMTREEAAAVVMRLYDYINRNHALY